MMTFCCPCLFGIEGILGDELRRMDLKNLRVQTGRVLFDGDWDAMVRVNLCSRYAERVGLVMGSFRAVTFEELFQGVKALPWEELIGPKDRFPVKGWSLNSALHSVPDCQAIVKKAVVERLKSCYGIGWFEESGALYQIQFTIMKDEVTVLVDTSGAGLHKRGWRANAGEAPIRETLAAAIADLTRARLAEQVCDPCCGSGTLLIEAALAARRIAPGRGRRFAFQHWSRVPAALLERELDAARERELPDRDIALWGGDIDEACLRLAEENAKKAGVGDCLGVDLQDLKEFRPSGPTGLVLCNPPYGERLLDRQRAEELYRVMGRVFVPKPGWSYAVITADETFEQHFGRPADKRRKLYNGMLKCQLYTYYK